MQLLCHAAFTNTMKVLSLAWWNSNDKSEMNVLQSQVIKYYLDYLYGYFQQLCTLNCVTFHSFNDMAIEKNKLIVTKVG